MILTYLTGMGDLVGVRYHHQFIAKQPDGNWYGFDTKPRMGVDRWETEGDQLEVLAVIIQASLPNWNSTLEEIDFRQVQRLL